MKLKTAYILWIIASVIIVVSIILTIVNVTKQSGYFRDLNKKIEGVPSSTSDWYYIRYVKSSSRILPIVAVIVSVALLALGHFMILRYAKTGEGKIFVVFLILMILSILYFLLILISSLGTSNATNSVGNSDSKWVKLDEKDPNYGVALKQIHDFRSTLNSSKNLIKTVQILSLIVSAIKTGLTIGTFVIVTRVSRKKA